MSSYTIRRVLRAGLLCRRPAVHSGLFRAHETAPTGSKRHMGRRHLPSPTILIAAPATRSCSRMRRAMTAGKTPKRAALQTAPTRRRLAVAPAMSLHLRSSAKKKKNNEATDATYALRWKGGVRLKLNSRRLRERNLRQRKTNG